MRILHISNEVVSTGNGIVNSAVDLACMQSRLGNDVSFVSSGGGYVDLLQRHGIAHYTVHQGPRLPLKMLCDLPLLGRIVRSVKPHIVHAHMMTGAILMRFGRAVAAFGDYRLVTTIHNEWRLTSKLMQVGDSVVVLSNRGKELFRARGFPEHKLRVVRHGVLHSPRRLDQLQHEASPPALERFLPLIVTMAGLYRRKGIGDLIEAFVQISDEFPTASLFVLGWGPDQAYFERLKASVNGGERIHFRGFVPEPHLILREAAIFVLASHMESFPLSVAEAREAGCAVVATAVGGIPELLEHGRAGILIPPHDPNILAQALRRLLADPQELARWRKAAQENIGWLSCERMAAESLDVYESLLQHRHSS